MGEQNLAARDSLSCERVGLEPMLGVGKLAQNPVEEQQNLFDASFGVEQLGQTRPRANPQLEQKAWLTGFSAPLLVQVPNRPPSTGDRLSGSGVGRPHRFGGGARPSTAVAQSSGSPTGEGREMSLR